MKSVNVPIVLAFSIGPIVGSCGLHTPSKDLLLSEQINTDDGTTDQGNYENKIIIHISCEIAKGLTEIKQHLGIKWFTDWGTTITQSVTAEDQSGVSPGITGIEPWHNAILTFPFGGNVTAPQSFSYSVGATASANALRTETIQYTFRNMDIEKYASPRCPHLQRGVMIDGDLDIDQFIYDKAVIANAGNAELYTKGSSLSIRPPFNAFTEEITFVAAFGGTATPTWKLARVTANTSSNLLTAERTVTNDLVITLGPLVDVTSLKAGDPLQLIPTAMS